MSGSQGDEEGRRTEASLGRTEERTDVLVVGGGVAGMAAAVAAREAGADVLLTERAFAGGNAVAHSLLPSKVHLRAAQHLAQYQGRGPLPVAEPGAYLYAAGIHLRHRREEARTALERHLARVGVRWLSGEVRFEGPGRARVVSPYGPREVRFRSVVIAAGSVQHLPPFLPRPDGRRVLIPRDLGGLAAVPGTAVVMGAGATGVEVASLLADYGCRVTLLGRTERLLEGEDPVLASLLADALARRSVVLGLGFEVRRVDLDEAGRGVRVEAGPANGRTGPGSGTQVLVADALFVAAGRRGDTGDLGIEALSLRTDGRGFIAAGPDGVTEADGVFAAGDVTGGLLTANRAQSQGRRAGVLAAQAVGVGPSPATSEYAGARGGESREALPVAVFARPEYARVGTPPPGRASGDFHILEAGSGASPQSGNWQRDPGAGTGPDGHPGSGIQNGIGDRIGDGGAWDRHVPWHGREPLLHPFIVQGSSAEEGSFDRVRVLVDGEGRLRGASILGEGAAERILLFSLALQEGIPVGRLQDLVPVVPTAGESVRLLRPYQGSRVEPD